VPFSSFAAMIGGVLDTVRSVLGMAPASYHVVEGPEQGKQFVWDHGRLGNAVDSEFVPEGERNGDELEALAVPPMELTATVPEKHEEGEKVTIAGPHGPMEVVPPKGSKPGAPFTYRLTPMFEFRVEVPPGAKPGLQIECTRRDGVRIAIGVPPNLKPGDFFEVLPPAIIVRVPDDAKAGDLVVFRPVVAPGEQLPPHIARSWIRTRVPEGLEPKQYFPARLPVPTAAPAGEAEGAGALGSVRKLFVPSGGRSAPGSEAEAKEPGSSADKEGTAPLLGKEEMSVGA